jgi:hypothetical protein
MNCCETETRNIFCSSESRNVNQDPNGNSYTLHLTTPIKDISKVELLHVSVPNTLYNLTDGTGVIGLSNIYASQGVAGSSDTSSLTFFSIPKGFYSASSLATEITNAVSNLTDITVTYLISEGKFLFTRPTTGNTFSLYSNTSEFSSLMGFTSSNTNVLINSQNVPTEVDQDIPLYSDNSRYRDQNFVKSEHVVNLNPNEGVFLDIEELRTQYNEDAIGLDGGQLGTYSGQNMSRSFGLIPMDVSSGQIKRFKKTSDFDFVIDYTRPIERLSRLTVRWVDKNGQLLDFNGLNDNSFLLRCHTLRKNLC